MVTAVNWTMNVKLSLTIFPSWTKLICSALCFSKKTSIECIGVAYSWIGRPIRADKEYFLTNQRGYDKSETTDEKLSARRI